MTYCIVCSASLSSADVICPKCGNQVTPGDEIDEASVTHDPGAIRSSAAAVKLRRFAAGSVDFLVTGAMVALLVRYGGTRLLARPTRSAVIIVCAGLLAPFLYAVLKDAYRGKSFGKLLFGLTTVHISTGVRTGVKESVLRNSIFAFVAIPVVGWVIYVVISLFAVWQILAGNVQRVGDGTANTTVIDDADVVEL